MKKLSLFIIGLMILGVSACRKVTNEYYTTPNQTIYETLAANRWTTNDGGVTYSATIDFVDGDIYQNNFDGIFVFLKFENDTYEPIPQTFEGFSYSYKVTNQRITIRVQDSGGTATFNAPGAVEAKIVMIPSEE